MKRKVPLPSQVCTGDTEESYLHTSLIAGGKGQQIAFLLSLVESIAAHSVNREGIPNFGQKTKNKNKSSTSLGAGIIADPLPESLKVYLELLVLI